MTKMEYLTLTIRKSGKIVLPKILTERITAFRELRRKNKRNPEKVVVSSIIDDKILAIPLTSEAVLDSINIEDITEQRKTVKLKKCNTKLYGDLEHCVFMYEDEIYLKYKVSQYYSAISLKDGSKFKERFDDKVVLDDVSVVVLEFNKGGK